MMLGEGSSNGVDALRFSPGSSRVREEFGIPTTARVIGFVGRLTTDKGVPELLEGFVKILRKQPECYLLLVGWFDAASDGLGEGCGSGLKGIRGLCVQDTLRMLRRTTGRWM